MKKIILDTNFLLIPGLFKIDIFSEIEKIAIFKYKLYIMQGTIGELNKIIESKSAKVKDRLNAKIGLQLIEKKDIAKIKSFIDNVDDAIIQESDADTIVATSDKELKKRLRERKIGIINLKKKQYLALE